MSQASTCYQVRINETGESFACASDETALTALAKAGRRGVPVGCRGGGCGVCKVRVTEGSFRKRPMSRGHVSPQDEADNQVLACCILPDSDLRLQVLGKMQRAFFPDRTSAPQPSLVADRVQMR